MSRRIRPGSPWCALLPALAAAVGAAGCQRGPEVPPGAQAIEMVVLKGRGGETLALVPVFIEGKGPFAFALDTGASRTVVDRRVAEELGLPPAGGAAEVKGVGGRAVAVPVRVGGWRVGGIELPAGTIDALDLAADGRQDGLRGLLGSDILSRFQTVLVDYKRERLVFNPGASGQLASRP